MLNKKLTITFNEFKLIGWMNRMKCINLYKINDSYEFRMNNGNGFVLNG